MRVTAIIVNWNGAADLPACLASLAAQDHDALEVLVVDNASTDGSLAIARSAGVPVHRNPTNRGYAGGLNDGIAATDAAAVLALNPDVVLGPGYVRRATAVLARDPSVGAVQGKLLRPDGSTIDTTGHVAYRSRLFGNRQEGEPDDGRADRAGEVFGVSGACALYRRAMLDDVGPLDERLFAYFEDVDLDWRMRRRGWTAWYEPAAVARHERGGRGSRRTRDVEVLNFRNRLLVVAKHDDPSRLLRALAGVVVTTALKAVALGWTDPVALARAVTASIRGLPAALAQRRALAAADRVPSARIIDEWFVPTDLRRWARRGLVAARRSRDR